MLGVRRRSVLGSLARPSCLTSHGSSLARYEAVWGLPAAIGWGVHYLEINDGAITGFGVFTDIGYALIVALLTASILTSFKAMGIEPPGK